jgi:type I restriction enzyme, S subunit
MSQLPKNWSMAPLGDVATLQRGFDLPVQAREQGCIPIFAANGPVGTHCEAKVLGPGVVTGRSGTLGKVHYVDSDFWPLNTALWVKDFHGNDPRWVSRLLTWMDLKQFTRGAGVPTLNRNLVHFVSIPLPPLSEQKRIAGILDGADALRAKRRDALAQLDTLLQSTFLDMFGDPVTNPMGFPLQTLKTTFDFTTGKLDSNAEVEGGKYPFFTCARETSAIDDYAFDCEALLLAGNNASADYSVKHYKGRFNAYQRTYVITVDESVLTYEYARVALEYMLGDLKRFSKGTNTKYLTMVILNRMPILVPSIDLQHRFATIVRSIEQQKARHRAHLAELDTLFASLQHRAFNGEL